MKYKSLKIASLILMCFGLAIKQSRSMEEVHEPGIVPEVQPPIIAVPMLAHLAIKPAVEQIFISAKTVQDIHNNVLQQPYGVQIPLAHAIITDKRYKGTALEKLQLAYQASKEAQYAQLGLLDTLFDKVIQYIDPCIFVHNALAVLLPDYDPTSFTLRDERLIKALLRKPGLKLADVHLQQPLLTIMPITNNATSEEISPDGSMLAFSMGGNTVCIWNIQENKPVALFKLPDNFAFDAPMAWSPDSRMLAIADQDGNVYFWHIDARLQPYVRLQISGMHPAYHTEFDDRNAPDQRPYAAQFQANYVKLSPENKTFVEGLNVVNFVDDEHNIALIYTLQHAKKRGVTWYIKRDTDIRPHAHFRADDHAVYSMSFSPDGNYLATNSEMGRVRVWNVKDITFKEQEELERMVPTFTIAFDVVNPGLNAPVAAVLSQHGARLAVAPVNEVVLVLDTLLGRRLAQKRTDLWDEGYIGQGSHALALSADGRYLAYTFNGKYYLYDIDTEQQVILFSPGHVGASHVFSPGRSFEGDGGFVSCMLETHPLVVYGIRSRGNLNVKFPFKCELNEPSVFSDNGAYFVSRGFEAYNIWQLPVDYLKGNVTWQQLRDVLARICLQVVPRIGHHEK